MTTHRIRYEIIETVAGTRYRATCTCGKHRDAQSTAALSAWGPEHVVSEYEREHAA